MHCKSVAEVGSGGGFTQSRKIQVAKMFIILDKVEFLANIISYSFSFKESNKAFSGDMTRYVTQKKEYIYTFGSLGKLKELWNYWILLECLLLIVNCA